MTKIPDLKKTEDARRPPSEEIWDEVRQALREQFPNPLREGCPPSAVLMRLAQGRMSLEKAECWLDHLNRCSPCFRDFEQMQLQAKQLRHLGWKVVAGVAIVLSVGLWLMYSHEKMIRARTKPSGVSSNIAEAFSKEAPKVSLYFETVLSRRERDRANASPPRLPRSRVTLSIYLAPDNGAGGYEIQLLRNRSDSAPPVRFEGKAQIEGNDMVLKSTPDFSVIEPGVYLLALRPNGGRWRFFPVAIS